MLTAWSHDIVKLGEHKAILKIYLGMGPKIEKRESMVFDQNQIIIQIWGKDFFDLPASSSHDV